MLSFLGKIVVIRNTGKTDPAVDRKLGRDGFDYITSAQPSPEILSLLRSVNADLLFYDKPGCWLPVEGPTPMMLDWLKVCNAA
jgi:hypothetical protein